MGIRKSFTTTIDIDLQKRFRITCIENDEKMNDVLEDFMRRYIAGELKTTNKKPE